MQKNVTIQGREFGHYQQSCFVIAEIGVNHDGKFEQAINLIDLAIQSGADAVKFQSFIADELIRPDTPKAFYQKNNTNRSESQYEMLKRLELSPDQQLQLLQHCQKNGCIFLSTPYDNQSLQTLIDLQVPAIKVGSSDVTNLPFLQQIGKYKIPVLLSTGMATLGEVDEAVQHLSSSGLDDWILLHCTSEYPAPVQDANLLAIKTLQAAFKHPVGFSDHTEGLGVSPYAVALGACVIEKHFTLDRSLPGPDHSASLDPTMFAELVKHIREVESALGNGIKKIMPSEEKNKPVVQKSIVAKQFIPKGTKISEQHITCKRPADGLHPRMWFEIIGKIAAMDIDENHPISYEQIKWNG